MEPKNEALEDEFPFQLGDFQVPAVSFLGSTLLENEQTCNMKSDQPCFTAFTSKKMVICHGYMLALVG